MHTNFNHKMLLMTHYTQTEVLRISTCRDWEVAPGCVMDGTKMVAQAPINILPPIPSLNKSQIII